MAVYSEFVALSLELITEFGESVTYWQIRDGEDDDPAMPWNGGENENTSHTVNIAFVPEKLASRHQSQLGMTSRSNRTSNVPEGYVMGLMQPVNFEPNLKDLIYRGAVKYQIERIERIKVNSERAVLYKLSLRE